VQERQHDERVQIAVLSLARCEQCSAFVVRAEPHATLRLFAVSDLLSGFSGIHSYSLTATLSALDSVSL
jgi:hypothetical protein